MSVCLRDSVCLKVFVGLELFVDLAMSESVWVFVSLGVSVSLWVSVSPGGVEAAKTSVVSSEGEIYNIKKSIIILFFNDRQDSWKYITKNYIQAGIKRSFLSTNSYFKQIQFLCCCVSTVHLIFWSIELSSLSISIHCIFRCGSISLQVTYILVLSVLCQLELFNKSCEVILNATVSIVSWLVFNIIKCLLSFSFHVFCCFCYLVIFKTQKYYLFKGFYTF